MLKSRGLDGFRLFFKPGKKRHYMVVANPTRGLLNRENRTYSKDKILQRSYREEMK